MTRARSACQPLVALLFTWFLAACADDRPQPAYFAEDNPQRLSEWGAVVVDGAELTLGEGVLPYSLNNPLFTDYAHKLRTIWVSGAPAPLNADDTFDFPVGTVITKTFYYPSETGRVLKARDRGSVNAATGLPLGSHRLIETRVLVRREDGWQPVSYVWNDEQTEAYLKRTGAIVPLTLDGGGASTDFAYVVPNENQCAACHAPNATTRELRPLGPTAGQLNRPYPYAGRTENQLVYLADAGFVDPAARMASVMPSWTNGRASLNDRARSYLAANCAHCHNPDGPADTSGLDLTLAASGPAVGRCKPPIAAGSGTGGRQFGIVPGRADASIFTYRMATTDPGAMMPELGRSLVHEDGVELVAEWINGMEGDCS